MNEIKSPTFAELRRKLRAGKLTKKEAAALTIVLEQTSGMFRSAMDALSLACRDLLSFARGALWGVQEDRAERGKSSWDSRSRGTHGPEKIDKERLLGALRSLQAAGTPKNELAGIIEDRGIASRRSVNRYMKKFIKEGKLNF